MAHAAVSRMDPMASVSAHVADVEDQLSALEAAFASGEAQAIEQQSLQLQRSLADSLAAFRSAEHKGAHPLTADLLRRLKLAQARIQAHQVTVHRAAASIERTLGVLFPREESSTYGDLGQSPISKALKAYR